MGNMFEAEYKEKFGKEGLTFDDVLLVPGESDVTPNLVDLKTTLCKGITLNIPIIVYILFLCKLAVI